MVKSFEKVILIVGDGMSEPIPVEPGDQTPLSRAPTRALDYLATVGVSGLIPVCSAGVIPHSDTGHLAILGFPDLVQARGVFEALGTQFKLEPGDLCGRFNLGVRSDQIVIDRRGAGCQSEEARKLLEPFVRQEINGVECHLILTSNYRGAVILRSPIFRQIQDGQLQGNDSKLVGSIIRHCTGSTDPASMAARILNELNERFEQRRTDCPLGPNTLLFRDLGVYQPAPISFLERYGFQGTVISAVAVVRGVGRFLRMDTINDPRFTARIDSDLSLKITQALAARTKFVLVNIKATDYASHQCDPPAKEQAIGRLDQAVAQLLTPLNLVRTRIIVCSDHCTSSITGEHTADPVACTIAGAGIIPDEIRSFDERSVREGQLNIYTIKDLLSLVFAET